MTETDSPDVISIEELCESLEEEKPRLLDDQEFIELLIDESCRLQEALSRLVDWCVEPTEGNVDALDDAWDLLKELEQ
jgi:hypothetical protein